MPGMDTDGQRTDTDTRGHVLVSVAAEQEGISARTIRRWITAGAILALDGPQGRMVRLADVRDRAAGGQPRTDTDSLRTRTNTTGHGRPPDARVSEMQQRIADLEQDRDRWHDQAQRTGEQLEHEQESVRGLIVAMAREQQRAEIAEGRIDELLAITAPAASPHDAEPHASETIAATPDTSTQERTGPFWRSWWPWPKD
jgi:DNA-binding transcriptional MerR regulator